MARPYTTHREKANRRLVRAVVTKDSTTVTLGQLKAGEIVRKVWCEVTQAFNAGTTNVLTLGITGTTNKYLDASAITEATPAVYPTGGAGPFAAEAAATALIATYAKTGTAPTTGRAVFYAEIVEVG